MTDDDYGLCPSCGESLTEDDLIINERGDLQCRLCGQRIDDLDEATEE